MYLLTKIKDFVDEIKWFFQRGIKGYCEKDLWEIDTWFFDLFPKMLREFAEKNLGFPDDILTEESVAEYREWMFSSGIHIPFSQEFTDKSFVYWTEQIILMAELFEGAKRCYPYVPTERNTECKNKAFDMLSKYCYDLWW